MSCLQKQIDRVMSKRTGNLRELLKTLKRFVAITE
jgi:hypothetical protein